MAAMVLASGSERTGLLTPQEDCDSGGRCNKRRRKALPKLGLALACGIAALYLCRPSPGLRSPSVPSFQSPVVRGTDGGPKPSPVGVIQSVRDTNDRLSRKDPLEWEEGLPTGSGTAPRFAFATNPHQFFAPSALPPAHCPFSIHSSYATMAPPLPH